MTIPRQPTAADERTGRASRLGIRAYRAYLRQRSEEIQKATAPTLARGVRQWEERRQQTAGAEKRRGDGAKRRGDAESDTTWITAAINTSRMIVLARFAPDVELLRRIGEEIFRDGVRGAEESIKRAYRQAGPASAGSSAALNAPFGATGAQATAEQAAMRLSRVSLFESDAQEAVIDQWVSENVDLITKMDTYTLNRMNKVLTEQIKAGSSIETIAKRIDQSFGVGESRARLIARDQAEKLNAQVTQDAFSAAGLTEYKWLTARDERVRDGVPSGAGNHKILDGTIQSWTNPPDTGGSEGRNHPGVAINCRCIAIAVLPDGEV